MPKLLRLSLIAPLALVAHTTLLALLVWSSPALAGRPLQTEDAGVLDRGDCEIEGAHLRQREGSASARESGLSLGCGLGWRSQVGVGAARNRDDAERGRSVSLGGKTGLWRADGDAGAALTLAWGLDANKAAAGERQRSSMLKLVASVPAGPGSVHLNLGQAWDRAASTRTGSWALAFEHNGYQVSGLNWAPMAEVFGNEGEAAWANIALRLTVVPERFFVDLSAGRQLKAGRPQLLTTGFKLAF